jgi:hypothetical protein
MIKNGSGPYGVERPSVTANGTQKFTGYFRDVETFGCLEISTGIKDGSDVIPTRRAYLSDVSGGRIRNKLGGLKF